MSLKDKIANELPKMGEKATKALKEELEKQEGMAKEPWQKAMLQTFSVALDKHGATGVALAQSALEGLLAGDPKDMKSLSLRQASDLLAEFQKAEVRQKKQMKRFLEGLGKTLLHVIKVLIDVAL